MRMNKTQKFKMGDLIRFVDIHTSIDVLPPVGFRNIKGWDRFLSDGQFEAKRSDVGVVVIPQLTRTNIVYAQILIEGELFWFDVDNLEFL